jgi:acyl carrier protein
MNYHSSIKTDTGRGVVDVLTGKIRVENGSGPYCDPNMQSNITMKCNLTGDLGLDSLDFVGFVMDMESLYKINIPDEEAEKMDSVGKFINYIEKHAGR